MNKERFEAALHTLSDRRSPIEPLLDYLLKSWSYNLYERRPGPALLEDGVLTPTDLDLACFMSALVDRGAVINLPTYRSRRARTEREGERVLSKDNRHGKCLGLSSNKEAFSFSVRIEDANVVTTDKVGAPRNFMLVDVDGAWHSGWNKIEFMPTAKENAFLQDNRLWTGHTVYFQNFVHPNRWASLYGRDYLVSKLLLDRMEEEAKHLFGEISRTASVRFGAGEVSSTAPKTKIVGESEPIKVQAFEAYAFGLDVKGSYPEICSAEEFEQAKKRRKQLVYTLSPLLRFSVRATELAFVEHGQGRKAPAWSSMNKSGWRLGVRESSKHRIDWTEGSFEGGLFLRHRTYMKTERVAAQEG